MSSVQLLVLIPASNMCCLHFYHMANGTSRTLLLRPETWESPLHVLPSPPSIPPTDCTSQVSLNQQPLPSFSPGPACHSASSTSFCAIPRVSCHLCAFALTLVAVFHMAIRGILLKHTNETAGAVMTKGAPGTNAPWCKVSNSYFPLGESPARIHLSLTTALAS